MQEIVNESVSTSFSSLGLSDNNMNFYDFFELSRSASSTEIQEAYFGWLNRFQDSNQALYSILDDKELDEEQQFAKLAFETLIDNEKRKHYDKTCGLGSVTAKPRFGIT